MRNSATYQKRIPRKPAERMDFSPANYDDCKARLSMTVELQSVALGHEGHVSTPSFLRQFPRVPPLITCSHVNRKRQTLSWIRPSAGLKSLATGRRDTVIDCGRTDLSANCDVRPLRALLQSPPIQHRCLRWQDERRDAMRPGPAAGSMQIRAAGTGRPAPHRPTSRGEVKRLGASLGHQVCGLQHNLAERPLHLAGRVFTDASKRP